MNYYARTARVGLATVAILGLVSCGTEDQEDFPSGDITIIVPYSAGGGTDIWARQLAEYFENELGETVVVENTPGASGALGQQEMMQASPDGHTLQTVASTAMTIGPLQDETNYTLDDVSFVGAFVELPTILAVHEDSPYESAEELLEASENEEIQIATHGAISQGSISMAQLREEHGKNLTVVPYEGGQGATTALLGQNVDAMFLGRSDATEQYYDSGELVALAVDSPEPVEYLPEVPTFVELGYEEVQHGVSYYGIGVHAETPPEVRNDLEAALEEALNDDELVEQLGEEYVPNEFINGEELRQLYEGQIETYEQYVGQLDE